jgi:DDE family transposase
MEDVETKIRGRFESLAPHLDERARRLLVAAEARSIGRGGVAAVSRATGVARSMIASGIRELETGEGPPAGAVRRAGGGRKRKEDKDPRLSDALDRLIEPTTRGDPESPLRWTCKSTRILSAELGRQGFTVSHVKVARMLRDRGYSLQSDRKVEEGGDHPDRDAQFRHIYDKVDAFQTSGDPVISVDAKKKELVGNYKNPGREWHPEGDAPPVNVYDFIGEGGKVTPYGVYDLKRNEAWVNVGTDHDTAEFAVQGIRGWWMTMGREAYPEATRLLVTADGGGSNGSRNRLWKVELQRLADETGLQIDVCHFPPGTSKWNKIEHRLFSVISQNWRGRPLVSHEVIVNTIAAATTKTGLRVRAQLDGSTYEAGRKVTDDQMEALHLTRDAFHGEWNYVLAPVAT